MDINLKIKVESPELMAALLALAEAIPQLQIGQKKHEDVETSSSKKEEETKATREVKLEEIRARLAELSRQGKQPEVKALIVKYGSNKLTDLAPSCYPELLKEAEVL